MNNNGPMRLLLIEDDVGDCIKFKDCANYRSDITFVGMTDSCEEGINLVKSLLPEAVILDLQLVKGSGSGLQFLELLNETKLAYRPIVVVTTSNQSKLVYRRIEELGADWFFCKTQRDFGVGLFIWIRRGIQKYKRKWGRKQNEELHQQEVAELTRELQQYKDMYETIRAANHSVRHRQAALERRVISIFEQAKLKLSAEASEELTMAITDIRELSEEYCQKVEQVKVDMILPSTNILAIDGLFRLFSERFADNNIDFKLKVKGSIIYMVNNFIPQSKLETMIGDHLQNAMIAVSAAKNSVDRNVLAVIGEADGPYEFSVHDGGIPFEADTLERLGTKHTTTHANDGGSGIGFMTTFETMQESGASLIIKENPPGGAFSTSVTIRFDGRNQYIIETYRPGDFSESDRYFVIGCK